ncbi:MAG TPA: hypothetical protein VLG25_02430 [Patescibacteria group bacterium]|nr:hypothetical protein [Patescibacteria group bacterium]
MQPTGTQNNEQSTKTANPQNIGSPNIFLQQSNLQDTVASGSLNNNLSGITIDTGSSSNQDVMSYVQQQAAPPVANNGQTFFMIGLAAVLLLLAGVVWYIGKRTQKPKSPPTETLKATTKKVTNKRHAKKSRKQRRRSR